MLASGTITGETHGTQQTQTIKKNIIVKNCTRFTDCINEINNTQIDSAKEIDIVMPMYNLTE